MDHDFLTFLNFVIPKLLLHFWNYLAGVTSVMGFEMRYFRARRLNVGNVARRFNLD